MLRLLLVVDSLQVGGSERHTVDLAVALRRKGHAVTVACSVAGALAAPLQREKIPFHPLMNRAVKRRVSLTFAWKLRRLMCRSHFDLVHAHMYAGATAAALATLGTGVPLLLTEHSEASWRSAIARTVCRGLYRRAARVLTVSHALAVRLTQHDRVPVDHITVIPNAVTPAPDTAYNPVCASPVAGVVARLHREKGVALFLEAAARIATAVPACRFVVVGDGPLRQELCIHADRLGLTGRIQFLGCREDARAIISQLTVLVVPSLTEGAPLVVLEAMAAGIPVVATEVGGIREQIRHGIEGILVPAKPPAALGQAVIDLLQDPAFARRLGAAGRRRAEVAFDHAAMVDRVEAIYRTVVAGKHAGYQEDATSRGLPDRSLPHPYRDSVEQTAPPQP